MTSLHDAPAQGARELYPHQEAGVRFLMEHPRALLADDVGLGKTVQAAHYIARLNTRSVHPSRPAVVWVTDATLIPQTVTELRHHVPGFRIVGTTVPAYAKTKPSKTDLAAFEARYGDGVDVLVTSYQWINSRHDKNAATWHPRLVVLDEVMAVKGRSLSWQRARDLAHRADRCAALTATPIENDPTETFAVLDAVGTPGLWSRQVFERDFVQWQEAYEVSPGRWVERQPVGFLPGAAERFADYLHQHMLRRTAEDVGLKLPDVNRRTVFVPLTEAQSRAHAAAERLTGLWGHHRREQTGRSAGGESAIVSECLRLISGEYRAERVVVYAENKGILSLMETALTSAGLTYARVDGDNIAERTSLIDQFRDPGGPRVLLGSRVLEKGLNLQHARVLVSLDASYNPAREAQREGRIRRIGSPHRVVEHVTLMPDTTSARSKLATLNRKADTARVVLRRDGWPKHPL